MKLRHTTPFVKFIKKHVCHKYPPAVLSPLATESPGGRGIIIIFF